MTKTKLGTKLGAMITLTWLATAGIAVSCSNDEGKGGGAEGGNKAGNEPCEDNAECASGQCLAAGVCAYEGCPGGICIDTDSGAGASKGGTEDVDEARAKLLRDSACVAWSGEAEPLPAILFFVIDLSTSMKQPDPSNTARTKWDVTAPALRQAIADLPVSVAAGMLLYPNQPTAPSKIPRSSEACVNVGELVPVGMLGAAGSDQRRAINTLLETTPPDNSGTPTHDALLLGLDALSKSKIQGNRYVVLMTDGQPTYDRDCVGDGQPEYPSDKQAIIDSVSAALGDNIGTFLIGAPGSEKTVKVGVDARDWLSKAATEGGTAKETCSHDAVPYCHFDMVAETDFQTALNAALKDITESVVPCDYGLPTPPPGQSIDPSAVNVIFEGGDGVEKLILRNDTVPCNDGWRWSEDGSRVILCAESCKMLKRDPKATLDVLFGCSGDPKIE